MVDNEQSPKHILFVESDDSSYKFFLTVIGTMLSDKYRVYGHSYAATALKELQGLPKKTVGGVIMDWVGAVEDPFPRRLFIARVRDWEPLIPIAIWTGNMDSVLDTNRQHPIGADFVFGKPSSIGEIRAMMEMLEIREAGLRNKATKDDIQALSEISAAFGSKMRLLTGSSSS